MTTTAVSTTKTLNVEGVGPVELTVEERGDGQPFLVLHGGAGPQSVTAFAQLLAEKDRNRVLTPTHPGFGGTPRPDELHSVAGLAALYGDLLDDLGLEDVTVIGNSVGGWIAAEMALLGSPRMSRMVLLDAVGIEVEDHPIADVSGLSVPEIQALSFHDPTPFRVDLATIPDAQKAIMAANGAALAVYAGSPAHGRPDAARPPRRHRDPDPGAVGRERSDCPARLRSGLRRGHQPGALRGAVGHRAHAPDGDSRPRAARDLRIGPPPKFRRGDPLKRVNGSARYCRRALQYEVRTGRTVPEHQRAVRC